MTFSNFVQDKQILRYLKESPDVVNDKYHRRNYNFDLFLGDSEGIIIVPKKDFEFDTHADIIRYFFETGLADKKTKKLKMFQGLRKLKNLLTANYLKMKVIDSPKSISLAYMGIILPKQNGKRVAEGKKPYKDVDGTYISFWDKKGSTEGISCQLLKDYCKKHYSAPYFLEVMESEFTSTVSSF